ncbi:MAG: hypothetical protein IH600_06110 [Bacteroidetes bacterium]|nr:hypothetical protein [Bacteroidota bacterium]
MRNRFVLPVFSLFLLFLVTACGEDDPIIPQEDHFEAIGVVLRTSGIPVAAILRGETADTLRAKVGVLGDHIDVFFYNDDEQIVDPPADPNKTLAWEIGDPTMLTVVQDSAATGKFEFHLRGEKVGATTLELFIMHEGHSDFRSGKIPVAID